MIKKILKIRRFYQNKHKTLSNAELQQCNGRILMEFCGIELPWKKNKRNISCIPAGKYNAVAVKRYSNGRYALWILDVPDRSQIMIHTGNFVRQLRGCLAPGREFIDIDNDGIIDVANSQSVMDELQKHLQLGEEFKIEIKETFVRERIVRIPFIGAKKLSMKRVFGLKL